MSTKQYLTPCQVAKLLQVSPVTVRHWSLEGKLKSISTPGGHRRYLEEEVEKFARENGVVLPRHQDNAGHVLIVDDNIELAEYLEELLSKHAMEVIVEVANSGFEAGEKMYTFKPDIVMLDLTMPGMNGFEVCEHIKQNPELAGTRVIAMTGDASEESVQKILQAGAETCLSKPIRAPELFMAMV